MNTTVLAQSLMEYLSNNEFFANSWKLKSWREKEGLKGLGNEICEAIAEMITIWCNCC